MWDLTADSVVFEIGSYKGRWALQIARQHNPRLYCFEPQLWACEVTRLGLRGFNALVFNYGLGCADGTLPMGEFGTDGCSFLRTTRGQGVGQMREVCSALVALGVPAMGIDLALINIEGYEYQLLPHMFTQGIFPRWLMVQFHEGAAAEANLRRLIEQHYRRLWDYGQMLASWERQ